MKVLDSWVLEICQLFWLLFVSSQLISYGYFMVSSRVLGREQICKCDLCCTMLELVFAWASLSCDFLSIWSFTFKTSLHFSFAHLSSCPQHLSTLWCNVLFTLHQFQSIISSWYLSQWIWALNMSAPPELVIHFDYIYFAHWYWRHGSKTAISYFFSITFPKPVIMVNVVMKCTKRIMNQCE